MNSTSVSTTNSPYEYSTIILAVLFFTSEVLPYIKKNKGNGIMETLVCLLRGSSCMAEKLADTLEKREKETPENKV
jgi:hypothetical protein